MKWHSKWSPQSIRSYWCRCEYLTGKITNIHNRSYPVHKWKQKTIWPQQVTFLSLISGAQLLIMCHKYNTCVISSIILKCPVFKKDLKQRRVMTLSLSWHWHQVLIQKSLLYLTLFCKDWISRAKVFIWLLSSFWFGWFLFVLVEISIVWYTECKYSERPNTVPKTNKKIPLFYM